MKKYCNSILKCLVLPAAWCFVTACEKEHLQPDVPAGAETEPLVYISAILDTDTVYFAGGVDSYVGEVSMTDTMGQRYFSFYLYSELSTPLQPRPCFKIYINNIRPDLGVPEEDLDSTIFSGTFGYQDYFSTFTPLAVTVEWYDSTGAVYSSGLLPQLDVFFITSVEDIVFGNKTYKKVSVIFECVLMEGNNFNIMPLTNGQATLLFGTE